MTDRSHTTLVPYTPDWHDTFIQEQSNLYNILKGLDIINIEHFGSTSIPGLSAKPIIDLGILIPSHQGHEKFTTKLRKIDYWYDEAGSSSERHLYRKGMPTEFHLSIAFQNTGRFWERQILFRDYLRDHPQDRARYEALKQTNITQDPTGKHSYLSNKTAFIYDILVKSGWKE